MTRLRAPTMLLIGDSITEQAVDVAQQGWALHLIDAYRRRLDITVRGLSGYNTRWTLRHLQLSGLALPGAARFDACVIFLGANDAVAAGVYQHVPIDEYESNLRQLVECVAAAHGCATFLLATPPPYDAERYIGPPNNYPVSNRTDERTQEYAAAVRRVAASLAAAPPSPNSRRARRRFDCVCVDVNAGFRERLAPRGSGWRDAMSDGLHLGPRGNKLVADMIVEAIRAAAPPLAPERLEMLYPKARCFDPEAPEFDQALRAEADGAASARRVSQASRSSRGTKASTQQMKKKKSVAATKAKKKARSALATRPPSKKKSASSARTRK